MSIYFKSAIVENQIITFELEDTYHPFNLQSLFGFHTNQTYPQKSRRETVTLIDHQNYTNDAKITIAEDKLKIEFDSKTYAVAINIFNLIGYIPLLGLIPCYFRLIKPLTQIYRLHFEHTAMIIHYFIRGALEGLGLGIVYLIPDLIVTVKRFWKN